MVDFAAVVRRPWAVVALAAALVLGTSGFSSCAGTTGPLFVPLEVTPREVFMRAALSGNPLAVALARVDGGDSQTEIRATVDYLKDPGVSWLTVEVSGRNLTLHANAAGLNAGTYVGTVTLDTGNSSDGTATLRAELEVIK